MLGLSFPKHITLSLRMVPISVISVGAECQSADGAHFRDFSRSRVCLKTPCTQTHMEPDPRLHGLNHTCIGLTTQN